MQVLTWKKNTANCFLELCSLRRAIAQWVGTGSGYLLNQSKTFVLGVDAVISTPMHIWRVCGARDWCKVSSWITYLLRQNLSPSLELVHQASLANRLALGIPHISCQGLGLEIDWPHLCKFYMWMPGIWTCTTRALFTELDPTLGTKWSSSVRKGEANICCPGIYHHTQKRWELGCERNIHTD